MLRGERRNEVIAMIIASLSAHFDLIVAETSFFRRLLEILGQKLVLLVEVVRVALDKRAETSAMHFDR